MDKTNDELRERVDILIEFAKMNGEDFVTIKTSQLEELRKSAFGDGGKDTTCYYIPYIAMEMGSGFNIGFLLADVSNNVKWDIGFLSKTISGIGASLGVTEEQVVGGSHKIVPLAFIPLPDEPRGNPDEEDQEQSEEGH